MMGPGQRSHAAAGAGRGGLIGVATLASAFGVTLLQITGVLDTAMRADPTTGRSATVRALLALAAIAFTAISLYVSAIVTSNTVETIVAGRRRSIALRRLIGSTAAAERRRITREGSLLGACGCVFGTSLGTTASIATTRIAVAHGLIANTAYTYLTPEVVLPLVAVLAMTWIASRHGSRRVLAVRPVEALGNATEYTYEHLRLRRARKLVAAGMVTSGAALLVGAVILGQATPYAVLIGLLGGIICSSGIVLAADLVMPPLLHAVGSAFGNSAPARLAAANAIQRPERSARLSLGLMIAVTLVTTFAVAAGTYSDVLQQAQRADPNYYQGIKPMLHATIAVFTALIGFSAIIAAIGLVNTLLLDMSQRAHEIGLLRAIGLTRRQMSAMNLAQAALLTFSATIFGLALGVGYGWCGAQSIVGSVHAAPGLVWPRIPITALVGIALTATVVTIFATLVPARAAAKITPLEALAVE